MVRTRARFRLDVASQKQQGMFKNTSNSLIGSIGWCYPSRDNARTFKRTKNERLQIKRQQGPDANQIQEAQEELPSHKVTFCARSEIPQAQGRDKTQKEVRVLQAPIRKSRRQGA